MEVKLTMGEKLKDLRIERKLTTKQVSQMTGISEAVYNGLENDNDRDTGYSRIIALAKFYDVPTDYLLGFTESRITKNIELKQLRLSDKAIEILMNGKQNNNLISDLIEHKEFSNLINSIDVYVRQLAAPHIGTVNNMLTIAQRGIENYYSDNKPKPNDFDNAMNYLNETVVNEDDFLRFRISERFNQILRDVYELYKANVGDRIPQRKNSINKMTGDILMVLDKIKSGEVKVDSIEDAMAAMMAQMGVSDVQMADAIMAVGDYFTEGDDDGDERNEKLLGE
ncbi:MAG: helix-turn-helix domain-containing protein [Oscillospiraceae bacterium]|nr:helix-turn-helix domain-containing protein [Oscillospiraceae bacterium]